jgi:hypothetical protein
VGWPYNGCDFSNCKNLQHIELGHLPIGPELTHFKNCKLIAGVVPGAAVFIESAERHVDALVMPIDVAGLADSSVPVRTPKYWTNLKAFIQMFQLNFYE